MKKYIWIIVIFIMIFVVGCSSDNVQGLTFEQLIESLNDERNEVIKKVVDINDYIYVASDVSSISLDEANGLLSYHEPDSKSISQDEGIQDVETLFELLRYEYAGYVLYGGDVVFDGAKDNIIDELKKETEVFNSKLEEIIVNELKFITDGHFMIGSTVFLDLHKTFYYSNEKLGFRLDNQGYYKLVEDEKYYIESINDDADLSSFMKLSIDKSGDLLYYIGMILDEASAIVEVNVIYSDEHSEKIDLYKAPAFNSNRKETFEEEIINDVPVLTLRRCDDINNEMLMKDFVNSGIKYKDSSYLIIDLRGNSGGSSVWSELWLKNYTDTEVSRGGSILYRFGPLAKVVFDMQKQVSIDDYLDKYDLEELNELYNKTMNMLEDNDQLDFKVIERDYVVIDNSNTVFVLVDKHVASAGEDFVLRLKTMNNLVVVGSPTMGCTDVVNPIPIVLPHSKMSVAMGISLDMKYSEPNFHDSIGIHPDIWLANSTMIERVIELIKVEQVSE